MTNTKDVEQRIWATLNKLRSEMEFSRFHNTKLLEIIGITQEQEKFDRILNDKELISLASSIESFTPPLYIYNFINALSKFVNPKTHFDPWLTPSSPSNFFDFGITTAYCCNQKAFEFINTIFANPETKIYLGDGSKEMEELKTNFDFITSFPPWMMRREAIKINGLQAPSDLASTLIVQSSLLLNENGKAIFLMPPSFLFNEKVKEIINKLGLFVDAVFSIPTGAFLPQTNIASNLVIVTKKQKEKTFIAELSNDENTNKAIIENYKNRKEGKAIQLGSFIEFNEFKSFNGLLSLNEMQELVKRIGYPPIGLTDVAVIVNLLKAKDPDEVSHLSNSVYLPKIGNSLAVTIPAEMTMKNPKNYFQIQLDETKANSTFVANYFNSVIGRKLRESLEVGATIPSISKAQLQTCDLYLPELKTQVAIVEIDSKIEQFNLRLEELKRNLWKQPKSFHSIAKELKNINQEEKLEHWIDKLPFPISSILWRYYATKENSKKVEHLFHFFEALSEFFAMLMLSALVQDQEFYKKERHNWIDNDEKFKEWYFKATFGSWNILTSRLSKSVRRFYSDAERKEFCKALFGNPTEAFMKMLTEKGIINTLLTVAELRNKWKGHGGISNEGENKQRVATLEQQLNELRKFIADGFEETKIISAKQGELEEGIWTFTAKELVGAKSPFKEAEIKSLIGLDKKKLYLSHTNQNKPVELLPFIKFIELSEAVYFYTSIESKNVRWVSYHFDKDPELNQPADNELYKVFDFLKQSEKRNS
ncbi:hypothetical protein ABIB40_004156 [Pedobacter sp. UYP30]|uniref:N-6 DNA methylase n=1 Tax=Pedobacter sp. UYP30 TaxID=1756400 RepID=UPI0033907E53